MWVTVADESSWDVLRAETPEEKALIRVFRFMTTAHGAAQPAQDEKACFQGRERPKHQVKKWRPSAQMNGRMG